MMMMIMIIISSLLKLSGDLRLFEGARFTRRLAFYASHFFYLMVKSETIKITEVFLVIE